MKYFRETNPFVRVRDLLRSQSVRKPLWYDLAVRVPPEFGPLRSKKKPERIVFQEDHLRKQALKSFPELRRYNVIRLFEGVPSKSKVDQFVEKQLELMHSGLTESEAFKKVASGLERERKMLDLERKLAREQAVALGMKHGKDFLQQVQAAEEQEIRAAEQTRAEREREKLQQKR